MTYPTDDPIRKLILDELRTTLNAIAPGATYRTNVRGCEHIGLNEHHVSTYPFVAIGPPNFRYSDSQYRRMTVEMSLSLLLVVRTHTNPVEAVHDFFEDVSLALRADVTRGGNAIDTHILGDIPDVPLKDTPIYATEVEVNIKYRYLNTDPSAAL